MNIFLKASALIAFTLVSSHTFSQTVVSGASTGTAREIKYEGATAYSYIISGLSTTTEADSLESIFKNRPGIVEIFTDLPAHKITVYAPDYMPESDLWEVLKFAGKEIISNPKEISKFY